MNKGISIMKLAEAVQNSANQRKDFIVPSDHMFVAGGKLEFDGQNAYDINPIFHEQMAEKLDIPKAYYDRMKTQTPALWENNVNTWLARATDSRMVRTVGSKARAFLSDRYRPLDNDLILETALPVVLEYPDIQVLSAEVTEKRMYLQVVFPKLQGEVKKGDVVQSGLIISNSEVGLGSVNISPLIYRLVCLNGMIRDTAMRKYHIGKQIDQDYFAADTRNADNHAFLLKIRDTVRETLSEVAWDKTMSRLQLTAENKIKEKPLVAVIEDVTKRYSMPVSAKDSILKNLVNGGDLSQWGLANSVTAMANNTEDYDRAIEYESIGGRIIDLTEKEWNQIAA